MNRRPRRFGGTSRAEHLAPLDPTTEASVADYVRSLVRTGAALDTRIHPGDEMYGYELGQPRRSPATAAVFYFHTGHTISQMVERIVRWRFGGFEGVGRFFDFASGFGRFSRFLVGQLPPDRISVAEIEPAAVRFQEAVFGVSGTISTREPESFRQEGTFDVVFACSFFSHLPSGRFESWLARLRRLLAPGGILIFSTHGMDLLPPGEADRAAGILFRTTSETERLDGTEYGTSYVTPEYVRSVASRVTGRNDDLLAFPFGLCGFQDVYVLLNPPLPADRDLRLPRVAWGGMDESAIEDGAVSVGGWATGEGDERPPDISLHLGDRLAEVSPGDGPPGARRRWAFSFPVSSVDPDDIVHIEATSARGLSRIFVAETTRPYLPAGRLGRVYAGIGRRLRLFSRP